MNRVAWLALLSAAMVFPLFAQERIKLGSDVEVYPLTPGIWRHVTYKENSKSPNEQNK